MESALGLFLLFSAVKLGLWVFWGAALDWGCFSALSSNPQPIHVVLTG